MNLHSNLAVFYDTVDAISERSGIDFQILEKDYYVMLMLKELSTKQNDIHAYFKGGTALYKILGKDMRFSEDIDLTVDVSDCATTSQGKKRLEKASNGYTSLPRIQNHEGEINKKGSITSIYVYNPLSKRKRADVLDRIGKVKIEATSFTLSDPHTPVEVSFLIYDLSTPDEQKKLRDVYGIHPFLVDTMTLERIFSDKVLAAESYYVRNRYEDVAKHMYDVAIMSQLPAIQKWLEDSEAAYNTLIPRWDEEKRRLDSTIDDKPFSDYTLFNSCTDDEALKKGFAKMQRIYVYQPKYLLEYSWVCEQWHSIYLYLLKIDEVRKKKETAAGTYTLNDLQHDPSALITVMGRHWNYAEWFTTEFPNGAPSKEAVLDKLNEEG